MNIYVGNIDAKVTEAKLEGAFKVYGEVKSVTMIKDKFSGEPRGFGFVEMPKDEEAKKAIAELNGKEFEGKTLTVNEARPKEERGERRSFGGPRRGGDRGGRRF